MNARNDILVFFNESDPDVQLPHPWDVKNISMSAFWPPTDWTFRLLHKSFIPLFHKAVDDAMYDFAHKLLRTYREFEDVLPGEIELVFRNEIFGVTPTIGGTYLSIAFKSNITVNKSNHKKFYRRISSVVSPLGDFDYCLAAEYVSSVLDLLGKGNYLDGEVAPEIWGFKTNQIREWFDIYPELANRYPGEKEVVIECKVTRFVNIIDITQKGATQNYLQMQYPYHCEAREKEYADVFLHADIFLRASYELKCKEEAFIGHISYSQLYLFREMPVLPNSKRELLKQHIDAYASFFTEKELLSPGIKIYPNRHQEHTFVGGYMKDEEICFYFEEKRDSTRKNKRN